MKKYIYLAVVALMVQAPANAQLNANSPCCLPPQEKYHLFAGTVFSKEAYLKKVKHKKQLAGACGRQSAITLTVKL